MALPSSKRRKLDHDSDEALSANENQERSGEESGDSSEEESTHDAPAIKQKRPRPRQSQDVDESALYSGGLYKSSIFKLQVDEMLAEVRPNYEKRLAGVDQALHRLNSLIEGIEGREFLPVCHWIMFLSLLL